MARDLLLVEADIDIADSVRRAFAPAGFAVTTVVAGEAAVDRIRTSRPDLILLDAELPDMSGFSVCNRIKRALGSVPLILYTSEASDQAIEAHRQTRTRADEYLRKPLDLADLVGRAAQLLHAEGPPPLARPPGAAPPRPPPPEAAARAPDRPEPSAPPPPPPPRAEGADPFAEWPRDPAPPRGSPEEKLEFFRERLKARDAFLSRMREAAGALRGEIAALRADGEQVRRNLEQAGARVADLESRRDQAEKARQSLSDVLSESIAARETAERKQTERVAAADAELARLSALREQEARSAAEALAAEQEALAEARDAGERDRQAMAAEVQAARQERDQALAELAQAGSEIARLGTAAEEERRLEGERAAAAEQELAAERGRAEVAAGELAEAGGRIRAMEAEASRRAEELAALSAELSQARAVARAHEEKGQALEQAHRALEAELHDARKRGEELAQLLDERSAAVEEVQGKVLGLTRQLSEASHREARLAADRAELSQKAASEIEARERAAAALAILEAEAGRLRGLEAAAEESPRLRRELATAQELLQQRTQQLEAAARSAHLATAERERLRESSAVDLQARLGEIAQRDAEIASLRRRLGEQEAERQAREGELHRLRAEVDAARRARAEDAAEARRRLGAETERLSAEGERQVQAETGRLRTALVELERRLESSARAEVALRKRVAELEREKAERGPADRALGEGVAAAEEELSRLREELQEMRSENDFLNGEVARYHQKNKELAALLKRQG